MLPLLAQSLVSLLVVGWGLFGADEGAHGSSEGSVVLDPQALVLLVLLVVRRSEAGMPQSSAPLEEGADPDAAGLPLALLVVFEEELPQSSEPRAAVLPPGLGRLEVDEAQASSAAFQSAGSAPPAERGLLPLPTVDPHEESSAFNPQSSVAALGAARAVLPGALERFAPAAGLRL